MHPANIWGNRLLARLDDDLVEAATLGLVDDAYAIGSAYVLHGVQLAIHGAGLPRAEAAIYLRILADSIEEEWKTVPVLAAAPSPAEV